MKQSEDQSDSWFVVSSVIRVASGGEGGEAYRFGFPLPVSFVAFGFRRLYF